MFDDFLDDDDDMTENIIIPVEELDSMLENLLLFYNNNVKVQLPKENQLNKKDFLEIFQSLFKPDDDMYELTHEDVNNFMDKLNLRHANRWADILVEDGYANYGVDTNGEIIIMPTEKLKKETIKESKRK